MSDGEGVCDSSESSALDSNPWPDSVDRTAPIRSEAHWSTEGAVLWNFATGPRQRHQLLWLRLRNSVEFDTVGLLRGGLASRLMRAQLL